MLDLKWIIVDEVQDSDEKQLKFLEALKGTQTHFFAVGDPNQVIYSWRGTGPNMFFLIKHRFGAKELTLPINYRSDEVILEAANRFLQFGGKIEGSGERGEKILVRNHYDPFIEAEYLTERIRELHEQGLPYREIAVFYRVQKQAEILEKVFERAELPYVLPAKQKEDEDPVPERPYMIREYVAEGKLNAVSGEHTMEKAADIERQTEEEDAVHLMTLHASKGLEFDYVFIIGMNQGLIPLRCKSIEQEEEERRLFFVGLTRARKNLELSYYTNPTSPGTYETPSNYLRMLPEERLEWEEKPGSESRKANLQKLRKDTRELIREKKQEEEERARLHHENVRRLKLQGFTDWAMQHWTFENDHGQNPQMHLAQRYVDYWPEMRGKNVGLLLWGGVGTGKSFMAGCIANALMEQEVAVCMTNFARIMNELNNAFSGRNEVVDRLCGYPLLVIDDFGMERGTEYALEQIYNIIDSRYRSQKPLIITTNLTLTELKNSQDTAHARIYDRLLELCTPIACTGPSMRKNIGQAKLNLLKTLLA